MQYNVNQRNLLVNAMRVRVQQTVYVYSKQCTCTANNEQTVYLLSCDTTTIKLCNAAVYSKQCTYCLVTGRL